MKFQVYYIHGFGSSANSNTLNMLQEYYPDAVGLVYDSNEPSKSIASMYEKINSVDSYPIIVGSSLGGWYAEQLTSFVVGDFILYNPTTNPEVSLAKYNLDQKILFKYKLISSTAKYLPTSRSILLSVDDVVIDPQLAMIKYKHTAVIHTTFGGHRMTERNMQIIAARIKYLENQLT